MLHGKILQNLFRGKLKLTVLQFTAVGLHCLPTKWRNAMSNKGTPRKTSFPVFNLVKTCFFDKRDKNLSLTPPPHPISPQINDMFWLSRALSLFSGGWEVCCSILFFSRLQSWWMIFPPPPPKKKKKNQEWENGAFWPPCSLQLFFWFRYRDWGFLTCFKIVDQTRKLQPSVSNISNVCFCLLKELVTNLQIESSCVTINFLRDKPLLPKTVMEQNAIPWGFSSCSRQ